MSLLDTVQREMVSAMKARDELRLSTIRMIKTALKKREVDQMKPLDEASAMQVLNTLRKQRLESIEMFRQGGREELAQREEAEMRVIDEFLPEPATERELDRAVEEAIGETGASSPKQMGAVMKAAQARLSGKQVDGKILSDKVRARLA